VTSPDAAALQDVLTAIRRRHPGMQVIIYPAAVQGKGAAEQIALAIHTASQRHEVDVLLICRGGGSIEDLWSFNEEAVARAIYACAIPTVSGVGHETDTTITDFVVDVRAATPTAAAELACPDQAAMFAQLQQLQLRLQRTLQHQLQRYAQTLDYLGRRLLSPAQQVQQQKMQLGEIQRRLQLSMQYRLHLCQRQLEQAAAGLQQLNPSSVLSRGYAIVRGVDGKAVHQAAALQTGEEIQLDFYQGSATAVVSRLDLGQ
jgi:exodeoxyribonuclease VII large subunit